MNNKDKVLTIKQQVYQIIKDDICKGVYEPGQQINEVELSNRLGISRSPIRESLRQLVSDGLCVELPNKGVFVKEFSIEEINNIYDYRLLLESYAIEHCSNNINDKMVNALKSCKEALKQFYKDNDINSYIDEDTTLHQTIVDLCGNSIIVDAYERVSSMNSQFRIYSLTDQKRFDESIKEHTDIIDNILKGNYKEAIEINKIHLYRAKDTIKTVLSD